MVILSNGGHGFLKEKIMKNFTNTGICGYKYGYDTKILALLHEHGSLNISDFERLTQTNRNTLKKHLANLTSQGMIVCLGQGKASFYTLS